MRREGDHDVRICCIFRGRESKTSHVRNHSPAERRLRCRGRGARLAAGRTDIGAVVTFTGICRGAEAGAPVAALTLEHYPGMAEAEIARHVEEAQARWPLLGVTVIHRYGRIVPGDNIVLVVTAASHRGDAFAAAEFLMDYLKTRAPFWKQEERPAGHRLGRRQGHRRRRRRALGEAWRTRRSE